MMNKKEYVAPEIKVIDMEVNTCLLSASSNDECENQWWCDNQPSPDEWWKKD